VCAIVTKDFLNFTYNKSNDLIIPRHGLKPGDRWCLCVSRWIEAYKNGVAPLIDLERTHRDVLKYVNLDILQKYHFWFLETIKIFEIWQEFIGLKNFLHTHIYFLIF